MHFGIKIASLTLCLIIDGMDKKCYLNLKQGDEKISSSGKNQNYLGSCALEHCGITPSPNGSRLSTLVIEKITCFMHQQTTAQLIDSSINFLHLKTKPVWCFGHLGSQ